MDKNKFILTFGVLLIFCLTSCSKDCDHEFIDIVEAREMFIGQWEVEHSQIVFRNDTFSSEDIFEYRIHYFENGEGVVQGPFGPDSIKWSLDYHHNTLLELNSFFFNAIEIQEPFNMTEYEFEFLNIDEVVLNGNKNYIDLLENGERVTEENTRILKRIN